MLSVAGSRGTEWQLCCLAKDGSVLTQVTRMAAGPPCRDATAALGLRRDIRCLLYLALCSHRQGTPPCVGSLLLLFQRL